MSGKRYTEEFKIEAVKQVVDRGYSVYSVAERLGISTKNLYDWIKRYGTPDSDYNQLTAQQQEIRALKAELKRVTDERDILKRPQRTLPKSPGKVRIHQEILFRISGQDVVSDHASASQRLLRLAQAASIR